MVLRPQWTEGIEYSVAYCVPKDQLLQEQTRTSGEQSLEETGVHRLVEDGSSTSTETQQVDTMEDLCDKLKTPKHDEIKESASIKELEHDLEIMKKKYRELQIYCTQVEERSMEITKEMSRRTETAGNLENVNDMFSNSSLAQRFESLYANKWVFLAKWLAKTFPGIQELDRISFLTNLMKLTYTECIKSAESQICAVCQVEKIADIPSNESYVEILSIRRRFAVQESARERVKKEILQKVDLSEYIRGFCREVDGKSVEDRVQKFVAEYIDCCWLMSVSNPPVILNFDVVGLQYTDVSEYFKIYSPKKPIEDLTKAEGTILEVVWPCVKLRNESAMYMKGDVVVVKRGRKTEI